MDGFKLGVFYREARINRSTGELLLYDWSNTKSRLDPDSTICFSAHKICFASSIFIGQGTIFHHQVDGPPVEFGTVLVYSCLASCWGDDGGPREEIVIEQGETM